ncbi:DUF5780 domain-containing protein [Paenibacillus chitinolyticus]|uniref:DUF5780 domain-containing protein n=1 Tax=Paenibacillus chitinolyticus TaxID=79263 RepID=UPI0036334FFA
MVKCSKCGNETLEEDSLFCKKCGSKLSPDSTKPDKRKKFWIGGSLALLLLIGAAGTFIILNNPMTKFKRAVQGNQVSEATSVYKQTIKGDAEKEKKADAFIKDEVNRIQEAFKSNKLEHQQAIASLETLKKLEVLKPSVEAAVNNVNQLNESRTSFKKGQEYLANKNFKDAIVELKKVIKEDQNYAQAQELISTHTTEYKTAALKDAEQFSDSQDYDKAIGILSDALVVAPNDSDMIAKKSSFQKLNEAKKAEERKKKIEETKSSQEVSTDHASIVIQSSEYKALYPDMIQVIVRNNTDKTVKNMDVSMLGYDSNGFPVKIKRKYGSESFEFIGSAESVNIIAKGTFGHNYGWELNEGHGVKKVLAAVKEVEYYDGTKWTNPYYEYWLDENKEKPLH